MKLTIDNLDGQGAVDYTAALDRSEAVKIERTLNAPSTAQGRLCLEGTVLPMPARRGRVLLSEDAGTLLFTGYLTTEPTAFYAGVASEGPVYRLAFRAVSDEWLLDKQATGTLVGSALGSTGGAAMVALVNRVSQGLITTGNISNARALGALNSRADETWSAQAAAVSNASYSAYRVLKGVLTVTPAANVVHAFSDGDGSLTIAALNTAALRELANDVTVSGAMEPSVYWTEIFEGDGTTTVFDLAGQPDAPDAGQATLIADQFLGTSFNAERWQVSDVGGNLILRGGTTGAGLTLNGGGGVYGQTTVAAWDAMELGGTIVIELGGVSLGGGSVGTLGGLFQGSVTPLSCFAGFSVKQAGGQTVVTPMVSGAETGTSFTMVSGHSYTLRLRMHCAEMVRVKQSFYATVDTAGAGLVEQFGGGLVTAGMSLVFELRDEGNSSNTAPTVLYDGVVASAPALASFVPVNSVQMFGSIAYLSARCTGSAWVRSTDASTGVSWTRLLGTASQGADCSITSSIAGKITFWPGRTPLAGEYFAVSYRGRRRAVARLADAASLTAEAAGGAVGSARWLGKIVSPVARCSADCESAAQAVLSFSTNRAAAVTGSYVAVNPDANGDIWPGDVLALTANGSLTRVIVRKVMIEEQGAAPETLIYQISFANDWAEGLGIQLSGALAADALLPETALELAAGVAAPVLANLQQMAVVPSTSALTIDAGLNPPAGGGFEVRRRDGEFGTGVAGSASGDLMLRTSVRAFSIPRAAVQEAFFVRMYDASVPPLYSRESSAIVTHSPLA